MADLRAARFGFEILSTARESAQVTRQGVQVALTEPGANSAATLSATRTAHEVLAEFPERVSVTRQGAQVALTQPGANSAATLSTTRTAHEVLAEASPAVGVTRQGAQVAFVTPGASATGAVRTTRASIEVAGRSFIPMTPFPLPTGFVLFLHNWARRMEIESAFSTAISSSAEKVSEERTGLIQKPYRAIEVQWEIKGNAEMNEMLVEMRRLVDETSVIPIYCDVVEVSQNASIGATTVYGDFSRGRYFTNGRVVVVQLTPNTSNEATRIEAFQSQVVTTKFNDRLELGSALTTAITAGRALVMPLMKVHPQTELEHTLVTNNLLQVSATFDEIYGETALPPLASDVPPNFDSYADLPILSIVPQWSNGIETTFIREGSQDAVGRGRVVYQRGDRHRVLHALQFVEDRAGTWDLIRLFESRRGRLNSFWVTDFDNIFTVLNISGSFLTVQALGDLTDFQAEMDYIGVKFTDGTSAVRQATAIQLVSGAWRITMDSALPGGYTAADVDIFGRARLCRMKDDALMEKWVTTNVCSMSIPVIELLAEQEVTP
jgi:hypothetical protein